jgi:serine/threonine protein kinase
VAAWETERPRRFAGYTLHERVGLGGSAEVFRAVSADGRVVALKRALPHEREDEAAVSRWQGAAALQRRSAGRGVLEVVDAGVVPSAGPLGPWPWLAQRWVGGLDLAAWVGATRSAATSTGPQTQRTESAARCLAADLAAALLRLRACGVVHRDLVARHVLVEPRSGAQRARAWLTDFGAAASLEPGAASAPLLPRRALVPPWADDGPTRADPRRDAWAMGRLLAEQLGPWLDARGRRAAAALQDRDAEHDSALAALADGCPSTEGD